MRCVFQMVDRKRTGGGRGIYGLDPNEAHRRLRGRYRQVCGSAMYARVGVCERAEYRPRWRAGADRQADRIEFPLSSSVIKSVV